MLLHLRLVIMLTYTYQIVPRLKLERLSCLENVHGMRTERVCTRIMKKEQKNKWRRFDDGKYHLASEWKIIYVKVSVKQIVANKREGKKQRNMNVAH